jgi:hypothetical protein
MCSSNGPKTKHKGGEKERTAAVTAKNVHTNKAYGFHHFRKIKFRDIPSFWYNKLVPLNRHADAVPLFRATGERTL